MFVRITWVALCCGVGCGQPSESTQNHPVRMGPALESEDDVQSLVDVTPEASGSEEADPSPTTSDSGSAPVETVDCDAIAAYNEAWEVCSTSDTSCAGVFTDGAGCNAYCAPAGLECTERFGGEPGCALEADSPLDCDDDNGHESDWCVCGIPDESTTETTPTDEDCVSDAADPPVIMEMDYREGFYDSRHNWVLDCYSYAYTAASDEHTACDETYEPDGSRTGTATFVFSDVPRGLYDAYMGGRHTENRNSAGALFIVDGTSVVIDQRSDSGDYLWDYHGQYCLEGTVEVVLDSSVNSGSDSVMGVRLEPVE